MQNPGHDLTPRIIRYAALLAEHYDLGGADIVAYNRSRGGARHRIIDGYPKYIVAPSSKRREHFWFSVGRAIAAAYHYRGCMTDYEKAVRRSIEAVRATLIHTDTYSIESKD